MRILPSFFLFRCGSLGSLPLFLVHPTPVSECSRVGHPPRRSNPIEAFWHIRDEGPASNQSPLLCCTELLVSHMGGLSVPCVKNDNKRSFAGVEADRLLSTATTLDSYTLFVKRLLDKWVRVRVVGNSFGGRWRWICAGRADRGDRRI